MQQQLFQKSLIAVTKLKKNAHLLFKIRTEKHISEESLRQTYPYTIYEMIEGKNEILVQRSLDEIDIEENIILPLLHSSPSFNNSISNSQHILYKHCAPISSTPATPSSDTTLQTTQRNFFDSAALGESSLDESEIEGPQRLKENCSVVTRS